MFSLKKLLSLVLISVLTILWHGQTFAQPYYYYFTENDSTPINCNIYRVDLHTGTSQMFMPDVGRLIELLQTSDGNNLFLLFRGGWLYSVELNNQSHLDSILAGVGWVHKVIDAPLINRIYLAIGNLDDVTATLVLDGSNYSIIDTVHGISSYYPAFLSQDESRLYAFEPDFATRSLRLVSISTSSNSVIGQELFSNIGPDTKYKGPETGEAGVALISYDSPDPGIKNHHYMPYDIPNSLSLPSIPFPWSANAHLSPNGRYVILNGWSFLSIDSSSTIQENSGIVYVFEA